MNQENSKIKDRIQPPELIGRRILPTALLILAGIAILIYGLVFNSITVVAEKEKQTVTTEDKSRSSQEPNLQTLYLSEPITIRDVTIGGLARLESGEIKRTYTGKPASVCPT